MSQPPSKPHGKPGPGGGWSARPNVPGHFRPPSPYSPSSSPHPQRPRGPPTPVHHAHPTSPMTYSGMMHPMSPVPIGMPISPGISPVFGSPSGYIQCPRPRWPSPLPVGSQAPRPYIPAQVSFIRMYSSICLLLIYNLHRHTWAASRTVGESSLYLTLDN